MNSEELLYNYAKDSYYFELTRKDQFNGFISIAITIITFQLGVLSFYFINPPCIIKNTLVIVFFIITGLTLIAIIMSVQYFFRHQIKYTYKYLSTPQEIDSYIVKLKKYNTAHNNSKDDGYYKTEIRKTIYEQFMKCTDINFTNNNRKSKYSFRLKISIMISTILLIISFCLYLPLQKEKKVQTIHIDNTHLEEDYMSNEAEKQEVVKTPESHDQSPAATDQIPQRPEGHSVTDGFTPDEANIIIKNKK